MLGVFCLLIFTRETKREKVTFPARAARAVVSRGCFSSVMAALVPVSLQGVRAGIPNAAQAKLAEAVLGKKQKALRTDKTLE